MILIQSARTRIERVHVLRSEVHKFHSNQLYLGADKSKDFFLLQTLTDGVPYAAKNGCSAFYYRQRCRRRRRSRSINAPYLPLRPSFLALLDSPAQSSPLPLPILLHVACVIVSEAAGPVSKSRPTGTESGRRRGSNEEYIHVCIAVFIFLLLSPHIRPKDASHNLLRDPGSRRPPEDIPLQLCVRTEPYPPGVRLVLRPTFRQA